MPKPDESPQSDDADLTYEQARDQLVQVVTQLESGGTSLAESLALWERGEALAALCEERLDGALRRVEESRGSDTTTDADD